MKKTTAKERVQKLAFGGDPVKPKVVINGGPTKTPVDYEYDFVHDLAFLAGNPGNLTGTTLGRGFLSRHSTMDQKMVKDAINDINLFNQDTTAPTDAKTRVETFFARNTGNKNLAKIKASKAYTPTSMLELSPNVTVKTQFANGGTAGAGMDWGGILSQIPGIADGIIGMLENNPNAYSTQPTLNASTMRNMVTPYAMGGDIDGLDEDQLSQLNAMAEEQGITVEELIEQLQEQAGAVDEEPEEGDEGYDDEDSEEEFAFGGTTGRKIEVEGGEVIETPDGSIGKVKGPSHAKGGVDLTVPSGTKVFSDRLTIEGKTMQERKIKRERALARINKLIDKNPHDTLLKNTLSRTTETHEAEDAQDMALQNVANALYNSPKKYPYGGGVPYSKTGYDFSKVGDPLADYYGGGLDFQNFMKTAFPTNVVTNTQAPITSASDSPVATPEANPGNVSAMGAGDYIGLLGNAFNAIAPIINTNRNAENNRPNVNRFKTFGQRAIDANTDAQDYVAGVKSNAITDLNTSANSSYARNRNSASSVNTVRALDAITDMGKNKAANSIDNSFSTQMMGLLGQRGQLTNVQDKIVMSGEAQRDSEDKADMDNYYSNMAQNLTNFGNNVQGIGRSLNVARSNKIDSTLLSQLSQYGLSFDRNGKLISTK